MGGARAGRAPLDPPMVNVPAYYSTTHFSTILEFEIWKIVKYERNATLSEIKQKEYRKIKEDPKILNFGATSWI